MKALLRKSLGLNDPVHFLSKPLRIDERVHLRDAPPLGKSLPVTLQRRLRIAACAAMTASALALAPAPAVGVGQPVDLGTPAVLSLQGQRLKVLVPVKSAPGDRATATSFLVRETEVPFGHRAVPAQAFTIMSPANANYVVFQSHEAVDAPQVSLVVSVAGDARGPYRMDLQIPTSESFRR